MNHSELIDELVSRLDPIMVDGFTRGAAAKTIKALVEIVTGEMAAKNSVTIPNFGSFRGLPQAARVGRNPATGEEVSIPATTRVTFRAGRALKDAMANGRV